MNDLAEEPKHAPEWGYRFQKGYDPRRYVTQPTYGMRRVLALVESLVDDMARTGEIRRQLESMAREDFPKFWKLVVVPLLPRETRLQVTDHIIKVVQNVTLDDV